MKPLSRTLKPFKRDERAERALYLVIKMNEKFEITINRISPTLKRITHRLNGHFSFFDDDDLFQEALIYLWLSSEKGILDDKTDSYILQGCYFHLKNYLRTTLDKAKLVSLYQPIDKEDTSLEDMLPQAISPENPLDKEFIMEAAKYNGINGRELEILAFYMGGMTSREIGEQLGISHVMVLKLKNRIKDKYAGLKDICQG